MTPEEVIVAAILDEMRVRPHSQPEDYAGAVIIALEEEGYTIHKDDPSMVYVPREPTEEIIKRMAGGLSDKCGPFAVGEAEECCANDYRAMISAVDGATT